MAEIQIEFFQHVLNSMEIPVIPDVYDCNKKFPERDIYQLVHEINSFQRFLKIFQWTYSDTAYGNHNVWIALWSHLFKQFRHFYFS